MGQNGFCQKYNISLSECIFSNGTQDSNYSRKYFSWQQGGISRVFRRFGFQGLLRDNRKTCHSAKHDLYTCNIGIYINIYFLKFVLTFKKTVLKKMLSRTHAYMLILYIKYSILMLDMIYFPLKLLMDFYEILYAHSIGLRMRIKVFI